MTTPWLEQSAATVIKAMAGKESFSADDVRPILEGPYHPNAVGSLFKHLVGLKRIQFVGTKCSDCPSRNGSLIRTWRVKCS